jgi:uncharacterized protein YabE (DUF348 family)
VVWTTAPTVQAALDAFGVRSQGAFISVSRASRIPHDGLALQVRTPRTVTVLADGQRQDVVTTASTFGDVLKESGLEVRDRDRVSVRLADLPTPDAVVSITRVEGRAGVRSDPIPFKTITRKDSSRLKGTRSVVQSGRPGVLEVRYENVYFDGTKTSTRTLAKKVKVKPINRIVEVGTASIPKAPRDVASLNWKALAQCESTGRPTVVSPNGLYYGLYQFLPATWRAVGGTGLPSEASPAEQTYRAQRLYQVANWRTQWPVCGVRLFS